MPRRAAQRASGAVDEPNMVLPLASSYNERGVQGYTHTVTNSEDQRKINCFYEIARNAATGKGTLTLTKRPGVTVDAGTYGTGTSQDVYLVIILTTTTQSKGVGALLPVVIDVSGGNIRASISGTSNTVVAAGNLLPNHIDLTNISGTVNLVLQVKDSIVNIAQRAFFSTNATAWTEITDGNFTGLVHRGKIEHMDGFAFILDATNKIFNSDVNSLANWTNTSFISRSTQDAPVGLARLGNQILAFGDDSMEPFYNAGNTTGSPLLPIKQLVQKVGLVPPSISSRIFGHYYCIIGSRIFFIGRESGGIKSAGAYAYNGQATEKISSPYIDKILSEVVNTSFYSVNTIGHHGQKAAAFLLTAPNAASQRWLMFYPDLKEWFEWTSDVFSSINDSNFFLPCGSSSKNKLYAFAAIDNWQDNAVSYAWSTQFKLPTNGSSTKFMPMYGIDADTDTTTNDLTVEISTIDPQVFSILGTIDQTQDRKVAFEGGSFTKAWIRLGNTNARPSRIHNWLARIE